MNDGATVANQAGYNATSHLKKCFTWVSLQEAGRRVQTHRNEPANAPQVAQSEHLRSYHVERIDYGNNEVSGAAGENTCTDGVITASMHDGPPLQAWILKCDKSDG